jgi:type II secretory pathway component PulK
MTRRGFTLISVLWTLVILSTAGVAAMETARVGAKISGNRIRLARSAWARAACAEILAARFAQAPTTRRLDTVDLGGGVWCTAALTNPHRRLNLNLATREQLWRLLRNDSLVGSLRDWVDEDTMSAAGGPENLWYREGRRLLPRNGPLAAIEELALVRGFDPEVIARIEPVVTVQGEGALDRAEAPRAVLEVALGVTPDSAARLGSSGDPRPPNTLILAVAGGIRQTPIVATGTVLLRVDGSRLVTLWREMP